MMRTLLCVTLLALAAVSPDTADAQTQQPAPQAQKPASPEQNHTTNLAEYRIGPEDMLQIAIWKNDAMSREVPVRPDGMISLPLLSDVQAAGLTPLELRDSLLKRLAEYMPAPEVSVIVKAVKSFKVSVIGEIKKPGRYELGSWTTVLDILAEAGGFTEFATRTRIVILRPEGKDMKRVPFNYNKVIGSGGEQENFYLRPGDIVLVP